MYTRDELLTLLGNTKTSAHLNMIQKAVIAAVTEGILGQVDSNDGLSADQIRVNTDRQLLNMVGPAAASAAVEYSIHHCRKQGQLRGLKFNGSYVHNANLIHNDPGGNPPFSSVLRQFLLPRYAYLDFDTMVDPRHRVDHECGYPKFITPIMYRYMYDRDDIARRVVDVYPNESWAVDPDVFEDEDENNDTAFEEDYKNLCEVYNLIGLLYRIDRLSGIGHYGTLLVGLDDGKNLEEPVDEPDLLAGKRNSIGKKKRDILYFRPFDEYLSFIVQYETDTNHPRYGLPVMYNLVFLDMTIDAAGASVGTRLNRRVHWTRVVHVADNLMGSLVFGIPRQQPVFNRELDLRKLKGGSAEMFWKGAYPGISFEVDPKFVADNPDFDKEGAREEVADYFNGTQKSFFLQGIKATSLQGTLCDNPQNFVKIQEEAIACALEMPFRVFKGSEEGRLASDQDKQTWNQRLGRRCRLHVSPGVIRNTLDRLIALGAMRPPKMNNGRYMTEWPDLNARTDEEKADLSLKWTQALSQYVTSGIIHLIPPMDYLTMILGLRPSQAKKIIDAVEKAGGFSKLMAVDPAQQANSNPNGVSGDKPTSKPRNTADKQAEGKTS